MARDQRLRDQRPRDQPPRHPVLLRRFAKPPRIFCLRFLLHGARLRLAVLLPFLVLISLLLLNPILRLPRFPSTFLLDPAIASTTQSADRVSSVSRAIPVLPYTHLSHIRPQRHIPSTTSPIILYRHLLTSLNPHHHNTLHTLRTILHHETRHPSLDRRWHIQTPTNLTELNAILHLLHTHGETYTLNPLNVTSLRSIRPNFLHPQLKKTPLHSPLFRNKPLHSDHDTITNVLHALFAPFVVVAHNAAAARALMLKYSFEAGAQYTIVTSSDVILTAAAIEDILAVVHAHRDNPPPVITIPVTPIVVANDDINATLLSDDDRDDVNAVPPQLPDLLIHRGAPVGVNETLFFELDSHIDLLLRSNVTGVWRDALHPDQFPNLPPFPSPKVVSQSTPATTASIRRLAPDKSSTQNTISHRRYQHADTLYRLHALCFQANARVNFAYTDDTLLLFDGMQLQENRKAFQTQSSPALRSLVANMTKLANEELARNVVYSVMDKEVVPPSRNKHDYLSWSPYLWSSDNTTATEDMASTRLEYRDGQRAPGTVLYDAYSNRFDRTRLANFHRNVTILTLSAFFTGDDRYAAHAARQVRAWFVDTATAMTPHLRQGMLRIPPLGGRPYSGGIIDGLDLAFVYDCVKLLRGMHALNDDDTAVMRNWTAEYVKHVFKRQPERLAADNHGVAFDVNVGAAAAMCATREDGVPECVDAIAYTGGLGAARQLVQIWNDGRMPRELARKTPMHYMLYATGLFLAAARVGGRFGVDWWGVRRGDDGGGSEPLLRAMLKFNVLFLRRGWPPSSYADANVTEMARALPYYFEGRGRYADLEVFERVEGSVGVMVEAPGCVFEAPALVEDTAFIGAFWNVAARPLPGTCE